MPAVDPEMLRQFVEVVPVGVCIIGTDGKVLYWNKEAERITNRHAQDLIGHSSGSEVLMHCGVQGVPLCGGNKCLFTYAHRHGNQADTRMFAQHQDGHRVPVRVKSVPLFNEYGKAMAIAELFQPENAGLPLNWMAESRPTRAGVPIPKLDTMSQTLTTTYLRNELAEAADGVAVFLVEIENLQEMIRHRGAEMAQVMLRTLLQTLNEQVHTPHFIGLWSGHRFVIAVLRSTPESFRELLQGFQGVGGTCSVVWWGDTVMAQVRVGGTISRREDSLETIMARLEESAAMNQGQGDALPCS